MNSAERRSGMFIPRFQDMAENKTATVRLYSPTGSVCACGPKSLAEIQACAKRVPPRRGLGLNIHVSKDWLPWSFQHSAAYYHQQRLIWQAEQKLIVLTALRIVFPDDESDVQRLKRCLGGRPDSRSSGTFIRLTIGPGTSEEVRRASRARDLAARKACSLGYLTTLVDDEGGRNLLTPANDKKSVKKGGRR